MHDDIDEDVIECTTGVDGCEQECHNSNGSYTCSCRLGYRLHSDGQQCIGELDDNSTMS